MHFLLEAIIVGLLVVIVGTFVGFIIGKFFSIPLPKTCKKWNKYHIMEISLFITGFLVHIICELLGLNKLYCKKGYACKK